MSLIPTTAIPAPFNCRSDCGACCIAPSISSDIPNMPNGKPEGIACVHLTENKQCALFNQPERPAVCASLQPCFSMCGHNANEALAYLNELEQLTKPHS